VGKLRQEIDYGKLRYESLSLLWKQADRKEYFLLKKEEMEDLNIKVFDAFMKEEYEMDIYSWLNQIPVRQEDTLYRQSVMTDFIKNKDLLDHLGTYGESAHKLLTMSKFAFEKEATVYNLLKRMDEVEEIKNMVEKVLDSLKKCELLSKGLKSYRSLLQEIVDSPIYEAFVHDVGNIRALEDGVKSIKIGLNLSEYLQPIEAILLEISDEEFKYSRLDKKISYYLEQSFNEIKLIPRKLFARETVAPPEALNALEKTIEPAMLQLITFCDQFNKKILEVLSILYHELPYYKIGYELYKKLSDNNEPVCRPVWEEAIRFVDTYHLNLGIDHEITVVKNTIELDPGKSIILLTGANRGGKTTITQAISINLWFGQLGYYIPGRYASMPYVTRLFIHFPKEETETVNLGRLGEECIRFKKMFELGDNRSFYVMNESFQGTSHAESMQIAIEILKAVHDKGGMVIFNTHLHELLEELEKDIASDEIQSFIAGRDMKKSPFIIEEGRPLGKSYAIEIAKRYGMLYEQLISVNK